MQKRSIGKDGKTTSAIGYGAMSLAGIYGGATKEEAFDILDACLDHEISHIDTSNVYGMGKSETLIGEWFAERGAEARDHFSIATKAGISRDADGKRVYDNSIEHLEGELDKSLKRLGADTVDLFYVHRLNRNISPEELGANLSAILASGKAKSVGISEIAPMTLRRLSEHVPVAAVQSEYSLSTRFPELGLVQECARLGTTLVAFSPVGRGLLTDTPPTRDYVAASGFLSTSPRFTEQNLPLNIAATEDFRKLASEFGVAAAGLANAWLLAQGDHVLPIPGTKNVEHLKQIMTGADMKLSDGDLAAIEEVLPVGWAHGDRYSDAQWNGPERYC